MTVRRLDNVGMVVEDRLYDIRGPEGVLTRLAEQRGQQASRENPLG